MSESRDYSRSFNTPQNLRKHVLIKTATAAFGKPSRPVASSAASVTDKGKGKDKEAITQLFENLYIDKVSER